jgi:hypothetical protein
MANEHLTLPSLSQMPSRADEDGVTRLDTEHLFQPFRSHFDQIAPESSKLSSYGFASSIALAHYLRSSDDIPVHDEKAIVSAIAATSNFYEHVEIAALDRLSELCSNREAQLLEFLVKDIKFRKTRSGDDDLDRRTAFMSLFPLGQFDQIADLLDRVHEFSPNTAHRIAAVCTRTFIEKLYLLVSSVKDVLEARISVCDWIISNQSRSRENVIEEKEALNRELANLDARSDLDSTRVHVDGDSLREWYFETQRAKDVRYKQTVLAEGPKSDHGTFLDFYNRLVSTRNTPDSEDLLADSQIGSEHILLRSFESTLKAFVADRSFGLDSYLSRRIRHGTLKGFLVTPVSRIRRRLLDDIAKEERLAKKDDHEQVLVALDAWMNEFTNRLDHLRKEVIQIRSELHPEGLIETIWQTPTNVRHLDAMMSRCRERVLQTRGDYDVFGELFLLCWDFLERDLAQLRLYLAREFLKDTLAPLTDLFAELSYDQKVIARPYWSEIHSTITARTHEVCGWFIRPVFRNDSYDLGTLTDSTISIVRELDDSFVFEEDVNVEDKIALNRGSFDVLGDILFVLIGNAAKHGKRGGVVRVDASQDDQNPDFIRLDVTSEVEDERAYDEARSRIQTAGAVDSVDAIQEAGVLEGFSGIRKIIGIVRRIRHAQFAIFEDRQRLTIQCRVVAPANLTFARERT